MTKFKNEEMVVGETVPCYRGGVFIGLIEIEDIKERIEPNWQSTLIRIVNDKHYIEDYLDFEQKRTEFGHLKSLDK